MRIKLNRLQIVGLIVLEVFVILIGSIILDGNTPFDDLKFDKHLWATTSPIVRNAPRGHMAQAGVSTVSIPTLAGELAGDFSTPTAQMAIGILFSMVGNTEG